MKVKIHLKDQSKPIEFENVRNTYTKDGMFCVMIDNGNTVDKFPTLNIHRVTEFS